MPTTELDAIRSMTIEQLIVGIRYGSKDVQSINFEELIRRFEPIVRRAWRQSLPGTDYEDYAQDVFLSFFRSIDQLRDPKAFPGYFRRIALTVASNHVRKLMSLDSSDLTKVEHVVDTIDEALFNALFVRSYLEHLPVKERRILELAYLEDHSIAQITEALGLKSSAAKSLKRRALNRLRGMLASDAQSLERRGKDPYEK